MSYPNPNQYNYDPTQPIQPSQPYMSPLPPTQPRKRHRLAWSIVGGIAVVIVIVVVAAVATAGNSTKPIAHFGATPHIATGTLNPNYVPPPPAEPTPADNSGDDTQNLAIGNPIQVSDDDGNKTDVVVLSVSTKTKGCDSFGNPKNGDKYILAHVSYDQTAGVGSYNPLDWSLVEPDGTEVDYFDGNGSFAGCSGELKSSNALHGVRKGTVTFEVSKKISHGTIVYDSGGASSSWKF